MFKEGIQSRISSQQLISFFGRGQRGAKRIARERVTSSSSRVFSIGGDGDQDGGEVRAPQAHVLRRQGPQRGGEGRRERLHQGPDFSPPFLPLVRCCALRFLIGNAIPARLASLRLVMRSKDWRLVPRVLEVSRDAVSLCEPRCSDGLRGCRDLGFFF